MRTLLSGYDKTTQKLVFRVYAQTLPEETGRQSHKTAHFAALDLLGAALAADFGVRHVKIRRKGLEKPVLVHDRLFMNLSHCKGLAVAAVGTVPLGVDAEAPRTVKESLVKKVCTPEEAAEIQSVADSALAFSRFWTLKEAYAKFTGEGIRLHFDALGFSFSGDMIRFHHPAAGDVSFYQVLPENRFAVSVCVPDGVYRVERETVQ